MTQVVPVSVRVIHKVAGRSMHHFQRQAVSQSKQTQLSVSCTSSYCTMVKTSHISPFGKCSLSGEAKSLFPVRPSTAFFHSSNLQNIQKHDRAEKVETKLGAHDHHKINAVAEKLKRSLPHKVLEVLDENGEALGSMTRNDALKLGEQKKLKLVMVNPNSRPYPTYRLMSREEFQEEQVRIKERLKKDVKTLVKEVRMSFPDLTSYPCRTFRYFLALGKKLVFWKNIHP